MVNQNIGIQFLFFIQRWHNLLNTNLIDKQMCKMCKFNKIQSRSEFRTSASFRMEKSSKAWPDYWSASQFLNIFWSVYVKTESNIFIFS